MHHVWLLSVMLAGCWDRGSDKRSVIAVQSQRAAEAGVQTHVTGEQPASPTSDVPAAPSELDAEQALALAALGYIDEGEVVDAQRPVGTIGLDAVRSAGGINVYTLGGQAGAVAVDMNGTEVHRWDFSIPDAWPGFRHPDVQPERVPWRRAQVLPNGDLIGLWSGYGIVRITRDAQLVWGHWMPVHHDLHVFPDESILTISTTFIDRPDLYPEPIAEEHLTWFSPDGYPVRSISLLDAFEKYSGWSDIWNGRPVRNNEDIFHANTVYVLEQDYTETHPAFRAGRVLTSMRHLDAVALVDPDTEAVVWAMQGPFQRQHDPQMSPDGLVWIFDNQGAGEKVSRMMKMDPSSGQIRSEWRGDDDHRFFTRTCGHAQQLSNGNLMIVSSEQGTVFELTPDQDVVWTYHTEQTLPGENGALRVARFFEFQRIEPQEELNWVRGPLP